MFALTGKTTPSGFRVVRLDDGKFVGTEYVYSRVGFREVQDSLVLEFEFQVLTDKTIIEQNGEEFKQTIGDILVSLLEKSSESGNVVFKGGK